MTRREIARRRFPHRAFPGSYCRRATSMRMMRWAALLLMSTLAVAGVLTSTAGRADYQRNHRDICLDAHFCLHSRIFQNPIES